MQVSIEPAPKDETDSLDADFGICLGDLDLFLVQIVKACGHNCEVSDRNHRGFFCHCQGCGVSNIHLTKNGGYCSECLEENGSEFPDEVPENPDPIFILYTYNYTPGNREQPPDYDFVEIATGRSLTSLMIRALEVLVQTRVCCWADVKADEQEAKANEQENEP